MLELTESHKLEYNLMDVPLKEFRKERSKKGVYYTIVIVLRLTLTTSGLTSALFLGETELASGREIW